MTSRQAALWTAFTALAVTTAVPAHADVALGVRAGSLGIGPELSASLSPQFVLRASYGWLNYNRDVTDSDATYHGQLQLRNGSLLLDWHPNASLFALTVGAVASSDRVNITGVPHSGTFTLNGVSYDTTEVGSVTGQIKPGHTVSPYVGVGFGNPVSNRAHWNWSVDLGAVFMGRPQVALTANCAPTLPTLACAQVQQNAVAEEANVRDHANQLKVWPVLDLGLAYRF